jgi:uncharacterized protein
VTSKPRIVLDTNVLISALVFGGRPRLVTDLVGEASVIAVTSEEIMTEFRRIVVAKFPEFSQNAAQLEQLLRKYTRWVKLGSVTVTVCRDPDDNNVIETALIGMADYIVSGDKDLLVLKEHDGVKIVKPAELIELLSH